MRPPLERRVGVVSPGASSQIPIPAHLANRERHPRRRFAAAGNKDFTVKVYPAVGHGFMNVDYEPYDSEKAKDEGFQKIGVEKTFYPYNATVADEAWGSLFDFFGKYL